MSELPSSSIRMMKIYGVIILLVVSLGALGLYIGKNSQVHGQERYDIQHQMTELLTEITIHRLEQNTTFEKACLAVSDHDVKDKNGDFEETIFKLDQLHELITDEIRKSEQFIAEEIGTENKEILQNEINFVNSYLAVVREQQRLFRKKIRQVFLLLEQGQMEKADAISAPIMEMTDVLRRELKNIIFEFENLPGKTNLVLKDFDQATFDYSVLTFLAFFSGIGIGVLVSFKISDIIGGKPDTVVVSSSGVGTENKLLHVLLMKMRTMYRRETKLLQNNMFVEVVNSQEELLCRMTEEGMLVFSNPAFERFFKLKKNDISTKYFRDLLTEKEAGFFQQQVDKVLTDRKYLYFDWTLTIAGDSKILGTIIQPIWNDDGKIDELQVSSRVHRVNSEPVEIVEQISVPEKDSV